MFEEDHRSYIGCYEEIVSLFKKHLSAAVHIKQHNILRIRNGYVTLPLSGRFEVLISGRCVGHLGYNTPLGLTPDITINDKNMHQSVKYRALTDVDVLMVKLDEWWFTLLKKPDLLKDLIGIQHSLIAMLLVAYDDMAQNSQYRVIRSLIYRYDYLNSRGLLNPKCSLARFISSRRTGGESYTFKVLKHLSSSGFLVYKNNIVQIIKELPRDL